MQVDKLDIKKIIKEIQTAEEIKKGSLAQREPGAKMVRCPYCRARRRMDRKCCNTTYSTTQRAWSEEEGFHQVPCEARIVALEKARKYGS